MLFEGRAGHPVHGQSLGRDADSPADGNVERSEQPMQERSPRRNHGIQNSVPLWQKL